MVLGQKNKLIFFILLLLLLVLPFHLSIRFYSMQEQRQRQRWDLESDYMFRGIYMGTDYSLSNYLEQVDEDPNSPQMYVSARDYIHAFQLTKEYFDRVYPFHNGSKVSEGIIHTIYDTSFITFVQMFKLNHPDWSEYSDDDCLQHFIHFIELNPDPTEYHVEQHPEDDASHQFYYYHLNRTPPTHEKPHFHASEIVYSEGSMHEEYIGSGYFRNIHEEDVPFERQMGIWGPNGVRRFHLYNRIALLERYRNGQDIDFLPSIQLRLADGTPFDISIDTSEEKNHERFIENETDDLFLFEESLNNEKRELRRKHQQEEELRQQEQTRLANEFEQAKKRYQQMKQFKNRESQQKIEKQQKEKELFELQMARWANFNASAYIDHPATIEMTQKFSVPLEPFVYRNLPVPRALPHEYRNPAPIIDDDDNDN